MLLSELPIPKKLITACEQKGIRELYPPQEECIRRGLLEGKNLLISIPTASGKTLVAEMAMHRCIAEGGKCLYVVPLKALASEKFEEFSGRGVRVGIATGDLDKKDEYLGRNDIIITTSEKADSLLRNKAGWMKLINCLVLDEAHLIDSEDRGATLEMVITKLRYLSKNIQIIALTATIGNPKVFSGWLDADHVTSDWRPVDLKEGVFFSDTLYFEDEEKKIKVPTKNDDTNLCLDCIEEGGQSLVFVNSRRNAEGFAKRMAHALEKSGFSDEALDDIRKKLEAVSDTDMGKTLALCTGKGASFHHAGMKREQRKIVEEGFRSGHIKVISSTPTLAAGLNLPARRVVIRDFLRFKGGLGMVPIPVREYRQMAGRAGRPGLDPYGESLLIAKGREMANGLFEEFVDAPAEDVKSRLDDEAALSAQVLSLISTGFVTDTKGLVEFLEKSFYAYINEKSTHLSSIIEKIIDYLETAGMITKIDCYLSATDYGNLVSRLYINPVSAEIITTVLKEQQNILCSADTTSGTTNANRIKKAGEDVPAPVFSDIGLLQLLCKTPDMYTMYVKKSDIPVLENFLEEHEEKLWLEISYDTMEEDFRVLKTAMLLDNWISEVGDQTICDRFGVGPGDIYSVVESMNWLLYSATRISQMMAPDLGKNVSETAIRVRHGVKRELLPLVRLKNIGRVRARRLFNNQITDASAIKKAGLEKLTPILGKKIAEQVINQAEKEENKYSRSETKDKKSTKKAAEHKRKREDGDLYTDNTDKAAEKEDVDDPPVISKNSQKSREKTPAVEQRSLFDF